MPKVRGEYQVKRRISLSAALYLTLGIGFAACLVWRGDVCAGAVRGALEVCGKTIIPAVFPFFCAVGLILGAGGAEAAARVCGRAFARIFRVSPALCAPFLIGLISGFPAGAAAVTRVYAEGRCTKAEAERAIAFSSNAGPAYVVCGIGGMLGDLRLGAVLYAVQIVVMIAVNALFARRYPRVGADVPAPPLPRADALVTRAVKEAITPMLTVCAFVLAFAPITALLRSGLEYIGAADGVIGAALSILELTNAAGHAAALPLGISLPICAFAVSFSGICVAAQISAFAADAGLSMRYYFRAKLICGAVSFFILKMYIHFFALM